MIYRPGNSDLRSILIDILRKMPESPLHRKALVRLLWTEAAGEIIAQHVTIKNCNRDGRIAVEVNDARWMQPIRNSSRLIIERINASFQKLGLPEYMINRLDIYPAISTFPVEDHKTERKKEISIPDDLRKRIDNLPEGIRDGVTEWYLAEKQRQQD